MTPSHDVTLLLEEWQSGDRTALDRLIPIVHDTLRKVAANCFKERRGSYTLITPTVLVNEAYIKLLEYQPKTDRPWRHRAEFFALAATIMLNTLADYAKRKAGKKHGGGMVRVALENLRMPMVEAVDVIVLDGVLERMQGYASRQSKIWKCRYMGGFSINELSQAFHLAPSTIHKELKTANGWLHHQLGVDV